MPFLARMPAAARARLLAMGEEEDVPAGTLLMRRGELSGDIYLLQSGRLEVIDPRCTPPLVLDVIDAGELVGELGFVDAAPRSATVRARGACRCMLWRRDSLQRALLADPVLASAFWQSLTEAAADRVRRLSDTVRLGQSAPLQGEAPPEARELAQDLRAAWARAEGEDAPGPVLQAALARVVRTLGSVGDADAGEAIGEALRSEVGDLLRRARTGTLLLDHGGAGPPPAAVLTHLRQAEPLGDGTLGVALDAALRGLPTLVGLAAPIPAPDPGAVVLSLGRAGAARETLELALGDPRPGLQDASEVVLDAVIEGLPDRLLLALLVRLRGQLPGGAVLRLHASGPAADAGLLDHLLGWPMVRRPAEALGELFVAAGFQGVSAAVASGARVDLRGVVPESA
ncbi:MAG: cyclic nucleotide-binding domain-containing protein [Alphaproteobacteria bacterium]|nr:cyclic nucleotide-binding domain-containing protein [Alphaproteobacteria bacterium]